MNYVSDQTPCLLGEMTGAIHFNNKLSSSRQKPESDAVRSNLRAPVLIKEAIVEVEVRVAL